MQFKIEEIKGSKRFTGTAASREDWINFTAISGYVDRCEGHVLAGEKHDFNSSGDSGRLDFHGTETKEEWEDLMRNGWSEGAAKAAAMCKEIDGTVASLRKVQEFELKDEGDEIDIDAFLAGEENHWYQYPERDTPAKRSKIVRLGLNISCSAFYQANQLMWRGVIATALTEILQSHGYQVEITVYSQTTSSGKFAEGKRGAKGSHAIFSFPAKSAGEKILPERLASLIGHPSAFRRGFFSAREKLPAEKFHEFISPRTNGWGYGQSIYRRLIDKQFDICLGESELVADARSAVDRLKTILDQSGLLKKAD